MQWPSPFGRGKSVLASCDLIIIAGGKGSRMREHFPKLPKVLFSFDGVTLLERYLTYIPNRSAYVSLGNASDEIKSFIEQHELPVCSYTESKPCGPFGGLKAVVREYHEDLTEKVIVILGDVFVADLRCDIFDIDLNKERNWVFYAKNDHPFDSDRVSLDAASKVTKILKKTGHQPRKESNNTVSGIYIFNKHDIANTPFNEGDIGLDFLPYLTRRGVLWGRRLTGVVKDVGTIDRYRMIERTLKHKPLQRRVRELRRKVLLLDLDGTVIEDRGSKPHDQLQPIRILNFIIPIIRFCNENFIPVLLVTNQGDIAKGFKTRKQFAEDMWTIECLLAESGVWLDHFYFCPHYPTSGFDGEVRDLKVVCDCRKPETGMFTALDEQWHVDKYASIMIGDRSTDQDFAENIGIRRYYMVPTSEHDRSELMDKVLCELKEA